MTLTKKLAALATAALIAAAPFTGAKADGFLQPGTLIGAAAGGLLGSQIGQGDGKLAATAAGTLLGAGFGYAISNEQIDPPRRTRAVAYRPAPRKVVVVERPRYVERVVIVEKSRPAKRVVVYKGKSKKAYRGRGWKRGWYRDRWDD
ncbi:glycine zipper 2TM domain-containing protein [Magnetospira sp. QH-2]|uniref:glycine zipper 2TM domain-containing protein n=1 Tax=Magnetospira sp. (strain QH-2) TaxID=1288970 RepID=UPI0003E81771|nr:glycine zipper 2TM domain-containing protein [Magnetospira sp. QH-2]CCQ75274.1 conserved protein of unknown function(similar to Rickettsia genus specific 17 kDa surface antigen) [Magnetospira sp. QH-2]